MPEKDMQTFKLPGYVTRAAPHMQTHLYKMIPYNTRHYEVKPEFVFTEAPNPSHDDLIFGRLNPLVTRMNLIHLAYYQGTHLAWSGSLLKGVHNGVVVTTRDGYTIRASVSGELVDLKIDIGSSRYTEQFHKDNDYETWQEHDGARLYIHYYTFPESLFNPSVPGQNATEQ